MKMSLKEIGSGRLEAASKDGCFQSDEFESATRASDAE